MDLIAEYKKWAERLLRYNQQHLLAFWDELNDQDRTTLIQQLEDIDFELLHSLHDLIGKKCSVNTDHAAITPADVHRLPQTKDEFDLQREACLAGEKALRAGTVGVILVAGGQSSRLKYESPKGTFPVGPVTRRSLFQYHTEKIVALEKKYGVEIPWYIMTNMFSIKETEAFFRQNNYFGKNPASIRFFAQRMLPSVDAEGKALMETQFAPALAPDGHGGLLNALRENKLIEDMVHRGLEQLYYFQVDNPLAQICDPVFIGRHILARADISAKTVKKSHPDEKLGNIVRTGNGYLVIEYTELSSEEKNRKKENGDLYFDQGSIGIHIFERGFLEKIVEQADKMPFHVSHKRVKCIDAKGNLCDPKTPNAYKFEQFIFDVFTQTKNICVIEAERSREFSPIKNKEGDDSPDTARRDLCNYFGAMLQQAGYDVPKDKDGTVMWKLEISPLFAMDTDQLRKKLPNDFTPSDGLVLET